MSEKSCALTGHRFLPKDFDENRLSEELKMLIGTGYTYFYCGMAEGFDLCALKVLVALKDTYPIKVEACVPYKGQENYFSAEMKKLYRELILKCDETTVFFDHYTEGSFLIRNRYMVDKADCVYSYCTRNTGGTAYTVRYAESKGKTVVRALL
ncbi:MAG: DUF1273 domain-containing protein [Clostridia bacterium]|nr:DUF1273 domain-containing protein [Clostridia bacterium]